MEFRLKEALEILERTPLVLENLLGNISTDWTSQNEGPETWTPFDIVGHLIYGEQTDWIPRLEIILSDRSDKTFKSFDRFAQFELSKGKALNELLEEFKLARDKNLEILLSKSLKEADFIKAGIHPDFGKVTVSQLLSTWVVHDLNHLSQIARVMAKQYSQNVGPWSAYLGILK